MPDIRALPLPDDIEGAIAEEVMGWHYRSFLANGQPCHEYLIPGVGRVRPRPSWQPLGELQDLEAVIAAVRNITGDTLEIDLCNGWVASFGAAEYGADSMADAVCKAALIRVRLHRLRDRK